MSKTLDKISLLLNQAENAGTEAEADAFMAKAQQMATQCQIDLEVARQHQADKEKRETPEQRSITLNTRPRGYNTRMPNNSAERVDLFLRIADKNSVKCNIYWNSSGVICFGFPSDIDMVEALYNSLVLQMTVAADAALKRGDHKGQTYYCYKDYRDKPLNGKMFKTAFFTGYISRISERLREAKKEAVAAANKSWTLGPDEPADKPEPVAEPGKGKAELVIVGRDLAVRDYYQATSKAKGSWRGGNRGNSAYGGGYTNGREAANSARLSSQKALT